MNYRTLGRTGFSVSEIGLGGEWFNRLDQQQTTAVLDTAIEEGINYLDVFMPQPNTRSQIGNALRGRRDKMMIQGHICSIFEQEQYTRTRDMKKVTAAFDDLLTRLQTDYVDVGMIHYIDSIAEYESVLEGEIYAYALKLREQGKIRSIGISSHNPVAALRAVESGKIDVLMFSLNPAYDLEGTETDIFSLMDFKDLKEGGWTPDPARQKLYTACATHGVGITVMKSLGAGSLLKAESSPFGKAMTVTQCCHYCLTRPGVTSVLVGCLTPQEVRAAAAYAHATDAEKDYSHIFTGNTNIQMTGRCMYCNHCQPCPAHLDIAAITKYLHLAQQQPTVPESVRQHYFALEHNANDCLMCGRCEPNCPFGVNIRENMRAAQEMFGKEK